MVRFLACKESAISLELAAPNGGCGTSTFRHRSPGTFARRRVTAHCLSLESFRLQNRRYFRFSHVSNEKEEDVERWTRATGKSAPSPCLHNRRFMSHARHTRPLLVSRFTLVLRFVQNAAFTSRGSKKRQLCRLAQACKLAFPCQACPASTSASCSPAKR